MDLSLRPIHWQTLFVRRVIASRQANSLPNLLFTSQYSSTPTVHAPIPAPLSEQKGVQVPTSIPPESATQGLDELVDILISLEAGRLPAWYRNQPGQNYSPTLLTFNIGSTNLTQLEHYLQASYPRANAYFTDKLRSVKGTLSDPHLYFSSARFRCNFQALIPCSPITVVGPARIVTDRSQPSYDYVTSPTTGNIISFRMPSTNVHEELIGHVSGFVFYHIKAFVKKLRANGERSRNIREIEAIKSTASANVLVQNQHGSYDKFCPDAAWKPNGKHRYPRILLEVAYSESEAHARNKALNFFRGTSGAIQHVLVFKVSPSDRSLEGWVWLSRAVRTAKGDYEATDIIKPTVRLCKPLSRFLLTILFFSRLSYRKTASFLPCR